MTPPCPVDGIPFEPLWYNSYVTHNSNIITDTVIQQFISLGITQVSTYVNKDIIITDTVIQQFISLGITQVSTYVNKDIIITDTVIQQFISLGITQVSTL